MKKLRFWHYLLCFLGSVALGVALLLLCACLPQRPIDAHVKDAALALGSEGAYHRVFDTAPTAQLDNYTDAIIMDVSRGTTASRISSILTNPVHRDAEDPVEALAIYAGQEADARESFFYPRYWMGFRVLTRTALVFLNYLQIRRYLPEVVQTEAVDFSVFGEQYRVFVLYIRALYVFRYFCKRRRGFARVEARRAAPAEVIAVSFVIDRKAVVLTG